MRGDDFAVRDMSTLSDEVMLVHVVKDGDSDDDTEAEFEDIDHESNVDANEHLVSPNNLRWQKTRPSPRLLSRNNIRFRPGPTFVPRNEFDRGLMSLSRRGYASQYSSVRQSTITKCR